MKDIEPRIYRKRVIIEGRYSIDASREKLRQYLNGLSAELGMTKMLLKPIITSATGKGKPMHDGYEGVMMWVESGVQTYIWERFKFLSSDIYSCKPFDTQQAVRFTKDFFKISKLEYMVIGGKGKDK